MSSVSISLLISLVNNVLFFTSVTVIDGIVQIVVVSLPSIVTVRYHLDQLISDCDCY